MWKRLNKTPIVVAACGFVLIAVLALVFGVGCVPTNRVLRTDSGAEYRWPETPVHVFLHPSIGEDWATAMRVAIGQWNDAVGLELVLEAKALNEAEVMVAAGDGDQDPATIANTHLFGNGTTGALYMGMVWLPVEPVEVGAAYLIARHELGHLLGLAHVDDLDNVMYFSVSPDGGNGTRTIQAYDVDVLRARYRRQ